ncbi:MAG TPA: TIGR00269 family protein [Geobacterales bacterium]|nr:TIGR00269 family protein [Geobacterales bacterium]
MSCKYCDNEVFYVRRYSGERVCKKHFVETFIDKVERTISENKLLSWNDSIMVAVSGGKDSLTALHVLSIIEKGYPTRLFAVTIDEGVSNYTELRVKHTQELCSKLGIDYHVYSFKDFYGHRLEEIVKIAKEKGSKLEPCSYCGVLRRKLLNTAAKKLNATKVVTGHNLDDEVQTFMINMLRGDFERIIRGFGPIAQKEGFIPRIKPLKYIYEEEIMIYATLHDFPLFETECRFVKLSMRDSIRRILNELEAENPGAKYMIMNTAEKIARNFTELKKDIKLNYCRSCGEPTSQDICRACSLLEEIGIPAE